MVRQSAPQHRPSPIRTAEVLAALSLATDLGAGRPMGHALRACYLGMEIAGALRLSSADQAELYYSFLLMHSGCTVLSLGLGPVIHGDELAAIGDAALVNDANPLEMLNWLSRHVAPDAPLLTRVRHIAGAMAQSQDGPEQLRGACEVARQVARRLGMPSGVQTAVQYYQERWDGRGPFGLRAGKIPLSARLLQIGLKVEAFHTARGRHAAEAWALAQKGKAFDPQAVEALLEVGKQPAFWEALARQDLWEAVVDREPDSPYRYVDETKLDDVALAIADFVDLKTPTTVNHSRETARIATAIARRMSLPAAEVVTIRRAALVHDLGLVAIPGRILRHQGPLSAGDQERLRLHPYYTERVLSRVPALSAVAALAGKHHERLDGTGYHRGLSGSELPVSACILALADEFQKHVQPEPGQPAPAAEAALQAMQPEVGTAFSPECFAALAQEHDVAVSPPRVRREWPAGLTDREVEVLRCVASGATNRQVAQQLVISAKTVAHHLEHIYTKIDVSSRAAAVFFAMEHELIG